MSSENSVKRERRLRQGFRRLLMAAAVLLVLVAALSAVSRALLPWVERYQPDFEAVVSQALEVPVRFGSIDLRWQGYQPQVVFREVRIDAGPRADALSLGLSWWRSLTEWRLVADKITLDAPRFTLIRDREGWSVADLSLEGRAGVTAQRVSWGEVEDQLARLGHLSVRDAVVEFRNPSGRGDRLTLSLAAELDRDQWRASGDARLAGISDEPMRFAGEGRFGEQSRVSLFLQVSEWDLPEVQRRLDRYGGAAVQRTLGGCPGDGNPARCEIGMPRIDSGRLDGQLWLDWQQTRLTDLTVQADVRNLAVTRQQLLGQDGASHASLDGVSATLAWARDSEGWHLDAEDVKLRPSREEPLPTDFVRMRAIGDELFFATDHADLGRLAVWLAAAPLPTDFLELLDQNVPRGQARDVRLRFVGGELVEGFLDLVGFGNTTGIPLRPVIGTREGRGGADLTLYRQPGGWLARVDQQDLILAVPGMFREPVSIDRLEGDLYWFDQTGLPGGDEQPAGLSLFSPNLVLSFPGLDVGGRFFYRQASGEQPGYLGVDTGFAVDDTRGVPGYLPRHVIGPRTLDWLDAALEGEGAQGRIEGGHFLFHGDPARAPFTDGGGYFSVVFDFHDLTLPYRPGWPALTEASGNMAFVNKQYHVDVEQGRVGPVPVGDSRVSIFDLDEPKLQIAVDRPVAIDTLLDGLGQTPLIDAGALAGFSGRGEGQFALDVLIGLTSGSPPPSASGAYRFAGQRLSVADGRFVFEDVSGPLRFKDTRFSADALTGRFLGESFRARIDPLTDRAATRIQANTRFTPAGLSKLLGPAGQTPVAGALIDGLEGETDVGVRADIPHGGNGGVGIRVESGLAGWHSRLPPPLEKPAPVRWPLTVDLSVRNGGLQTLTTRLEGIQTWRAELGFDENGALASTRLGNRSLDSEPAGEGAGAEHRVGLTLPELALGPWLDWWATVGSSAAAEGGGAVPGDQWWVDARIDRLSLGDWWLNAVTAGWATRDNGWWLGVSGEENRGELRFLVGESASADRIEGRFDRLWLHRESTPVETKTTAPQAWDLAALPVASLAVDALTLDKLKLGRLSVEALPENSHYRIDRVDWQPAPSLSVSGSGRIEDEVSEAPQGQRTRFSLAMEGDDLGAAIEAINGGSPIQGGYVEEGQLTIAWPGSPTSFHAGRAAGNGRFLVSEGQLKGIDPGAGRLVGLMSLGALADRLRLDFRDVTREGLYFDSLAGQWRMDRGRLILDPLELTNPSLSALIDGELQLVDRRLDLTARIYADFGMLLPLIGTVAGGPLVGGAVLALQETFRQMDQAPEPSVTYLIGGSFEQPEVTRGDTQ
ncbi:YhdP family protein [Guyparkeria sp.]|uniref:YhdP family phospholipid transporter n=1 Tax=Guyparkeria sp. TaxID=2035736 RepID=UPI00397086CE